MPPKRPSVRKAVPKKTAGRAAKPTPEYAALVYERLEKHYPDAHTALDFTTPFELLIATILSAQSTDRRVNMVTPALFKRYPTPASLAAARPEELEEIIKSTGFFRSKTKSLIGMATAITERHDGRVPEDMESLVALPGVGRKTANVVLGNAFGKNVGVVVDTHVGRVSHRLQPHRPGEDRAGPDEAISAGRLDHALASPDLSRPTDLRGSPSQMRDLFPERRLPIREGTRPEPEMKPRVARSV